MKDKIESAVAAIFENYERTPQLNDFKEEITMNLRERVRDLMKTGMDENEATGKALAELGDITGIADSIGRQKRKEAIGDFYLQKRPIDRRHAIGYSAAGAVLVFGLIAAFVFGYNSGIIGITLLVFLSFGIISACAFVFLGLTQETNARYPMSGKSGVLFAVASGLICIGAFSGGAILFWETRFSELSLSDIAWLKAERISQMAIPSLLVLLCFILPGAAMMCYLVLTREKRLKPWVIERIRRGDAMYGEKFGILSAVIWTFAVAVFALLGFLIGWHPAWIVFLFAAAVQMLALFFMSEKK